MGDGLKLAQGALEAFEGFDDVGGAGRGIRREDGRGDAHAGGDAFEGGFDGGEAGVDGSGRALGLGDRRFELSYPFA